MLLGLRECKTTVWHGAIRSIIVTKLSVKNLLFFRRVPTIIRLWRVKEERREKENYSGCSIVGR